MKLIEKEVELIIANAVKKLYPDDGIESTVVVQAASNDKFGDFQTNFAMINAKKMKANPVVLAKAVIEAVEENEVIDKLEIAGPGFINIYIKDSYLAGFVKKTGLENYDFSFIDTHGEVVIDYSSPNIAKRMHIGHLRSTIIGDSIKRIYQFLGYKMVADNHIGDWGTQFGKLIVGYDKWLDKDNYKINPIEELERIYVEFANASEIDPELENIARSELKKLQDGDERNNKLWHEFINVSLDEYNKLYKRLGIEFDTYNGESFYHDMMPDVIKILKEKGIAQESEGAQVVFFDENEKIPPCIVQKKDGAFLYATSDLACLKYRMDNYDLNKVIIVTDERQQDHFRQFFRISEKLEWKVNKEHIWFGIMRFADGIFSTRKGNIIRLEELLDEAKSRAYATVNEKNPNLSDYEKENIAEIVGVGAVKYADLSQNRISPVIFEWDKVLSFEGNTAPYLQYTYARIKSIIRKGAEEGKTLDGTETIIFTDSRERALASYLTLFSQNVIKASETYRPNMIADYLFELSKKYNTFYNALSVLKEKDEILKSRLMLCSKTAEIIKEGLDLLGIKTVERM